ncbi:acid protease B [Pochonia chlamydosporia 170]|uniref:Acid protease B n=1 Tax=Pochonia chlamydosporia 170 TaxID=1380566 RepID=A0A179FF06_METCM|nr:acid protease B [Pochonia chlamydosporia 170]OAQ63643.1 acid protease B [Pochonia chlamydosporia 170]
MKFVSNLLIAVSASCALAAPGPRRRHISGPYPLTKDSTNLAGRQNVQQPWAGAVQEGEGFGYVTGIVKVPSITGQPSNYAVSAWVGIDGMNCRNAILQTGLSFYGDGSIDPWYEWWPAWSYTYANPAFRVSAGDEVRMTVNAWTTTSGNSTLENLTTGQTVVQTFSNQAALCNTDAEFVLEDFGDGNGGHVPLVNFGEIDIYNTSAYGRNGWVNAQGANIVNLEIDGRVRSSCGSNANGVRCDYLS